MYLLGPVVKGAGFTALLMLMAAISALTTIFVSFLPGRVPRPAVAEGEDSLRARSVGGLGGPSRVPHVTN